MHNNLKPLIIKDAKRNTREEKLIRINNMLYSIRRINRLITREKSSEQLVRACCEDLVKLRGYLHVCVLLLDTTRNSVSCISAGPEGVESGGERAIKPNMPTACYREVLRNKDAQMIEESSAECGFCFPRNEDEGSVVVSIRLQYGNSLYGILNVTMNRDSIIEHEERDLLKRLASDLSIAINKLDMEKKQQGFMLCLRQNERKFNCLLESLNEGIWVIDKNSVSTYVSQRMADMLGYNPDQMTGKRITDFLEHGQQDMWDRLLSPHTRENKRQHVLKFLKKDGSVIYARVIAVLLLGTGGTYEGAIAGVQDITEQRNLERELLELSKNEQERLGQALHDSLGQLLTGIALKNKAVEHRLRELNLPEWRETERITNLINRAIEQTRMLANGLLHLKLEPDSFISGIKELITNTENMFDVRCLLECSGSIEVKDRIAAVELYMIAREAIHNALKHGCATEIKISIVRGQSGIVLEIIDNGSGKLEDLYGHKGLGLGIMRNRAHAINAALDFYENSERGLKLRCVLPV